ncbi:Lrp/AsnC family transcriptional regulator [Candidatus Micrarchaeota archaeon]|nr:Lrp/AsnC family transcriptional regulator [Candidatus Micrarchaeota archaeon]
MSANTLDETDMAILAVLREDAKLPIKELAKKVKVHPNTVIQRLEKLKKSNVILKYAADVDYAKAGLDLQVIIMMKVRKGRAGDPEQLEELMKMKDLEAIYATTGVWDVVAICRVRDRDHLLEVIQKVGKNEIVLKTSSQIVLYTYKKPSDYNPF